MNELPQVRVNVQAPFPSFVAGSGPITLAKSNGVWSIGYNVMATAESVPPSANFPTDFALFYDAKAGSYFRMSLTDLGTAIGGVGAVTSVFGRTGTVVAAANDYSFSQISGVATAAQLPLFTATANGAVVASGGGTINFLRADGSWVPAPGTGGGGNLIVGTTTITGGTPGYFLYDNSGVLGEKPGFGSPTTVSTLPSAVTAGAGARAFVTDATSTSFAAIVAGSGINRVPVYSDGSNWRIG